MIKLTAKRYNADGTETYMECTFYSEPLESFLSKSDAWDVAIEIIPIPTARERFEAAIDAQKAEEDGDE